MHQKALSLNTLYNVIILIVSIDSSLLEQWLDKKVVGWLDQLYGPSPAPSLPPLGQALHSSTPAPPRAHPKDSGDALSRHKGRLLHLTYAIYAGIRIQQLFNIIIEFPESEPALLDLKTCLDKVHSLRQTLVQSLRQALQSRLLHPGVNTSDILTAYISAIRALRVLDPTGVLLDLVCEPVKKYLRSAFCAPFMPSSDE